MPNLGRRIETPKNAETVHERVQSLLGLLKEQQREHYAAQFPNVTPDEIGASNGRTWIKVKVGTSVYAFIHLETGEIFKPATWKAPAKHARGNVYAADHGMSCCGVYSVQYLR